MSLDYRPGRCRDTTGHGATAGHGTGVATAAIDDARRSERRTPNVADRAIASLNNAWQYHAPSYDADAADDALAKARGSHQRAASHASGEAIAAHAPAGYDADEIFAALAKARGSLRHAANHAADEAVAAHDDTMRF